MGTLDGENGELAAPSFLILRPRPGAQLSPRRAPITPRPAFSLILRPCESHFLSLFSSDTWSLSVSASPSLISASLHFGLPLSLSLSVTGSSLPAGQLASVCSVCRSLFVCLAARCVPGPLLQASLPVCLGVAAALATVQRGRCCRAVVLPSAG